MMVLRNALVYDSENWSLISRTFIFLFGAKLYRSCHIRDKGV